VELSIILLLFRICQGATITYNYDNLNRLTKVVYGNGISEEFTYDAAGNRLTHIVRGADPAPPTGSIFINGDTTYTNSESVTLTISADDPSGVSRCALATRLPVLPGSGRTMQLLKPGLWNLGWSKDSLYLVP